MTFHTPHESYLWLRQLWECWRNARMTRAQLEAAQLRKFHRLVAVAQARSPYYRELIRERGIDPLTCVPTDFPILTKRDVMEHFDDLVTERCITRQRIAEFLARSTDPEERFEGRYHVLHTSGTSGTMGVFVFSHEAWIKGACHGTRVSRLKIRRRVAFIAATRGHFAGVSLMLAGNDGTNALFFNVRTYDVGLPLAEMVAALNEFQPEVISGYATALKMLGEAQERGELHIKPVQVGNGGEPLLPDVKAYLERVFRLPVMNAYASSEHLYMALTLPGAEGMHLLEDDLMFELAPDYTCVTNLFNEVMPLIRYRMDDVLVPDLTGRSRYPYTKVKEVIGRQEDALMFTNDLGMDDFIHPIVIVELVVEGLTGWQIVLQSKTAFRFRARFDPGLTPAQREATRESIHRKLSAILAEKQMLKVRFEIEAVETLAIDEKTGKFRLVMREPGYAG